jgi:MerR family redox-sensitive transcriptional activator SoxR
MSHVSPDKHSLLTISEFAARAGVATSALRYYEARGLVAPERTAGNQRRYRRAQLRRVAFIRTAQTVGLTLDEIAEALADLPNQRVPTSADWERLSTHWHDRLNERIRLLEQMRDQLGECIGCGCLSATNCSLLNGDDTLSKEGAGARLLIDPERDR